MKSILVACLLIAAFFLSRCGSKSSEDRSANRPVNDTAVGMAPGAGAEDLPQSAAPDGTDEDEGTMGHTPQDKPADQGDLGTGSGGGAGAGAGPDKPRSLSRGEASIPGDTGLAPAPAASPKGLFEGDMLIYCPDTMVEKKQSLIYLVLGKMINREKVIQAMAESGNVPVSRVEGDTRHYDVKLSDTVKVTISFDKDAFELVMGQTESTVMFDRDKPDETAWLHWMIKPLRPADEQLITFTLLAKTAKGWDHVRPPQTFRIRIKINAGNTLVNIWEFLSGNPEYTLTSVIIPIVTYVFGRRVGKKKATRKKAA